MKIKEAKKSAGLSRRLHFPDDEPRLRWLPMLLESYAIVDTGVAVAIRNEEKKNKRRLACAKGCGTCCSHQQDLPLFPHEIVGIYWYASEKIGQPVREILKARLAEHKQGSGCPFLIENACSIHSARPIGCRQFNVFGRACSPGEDPYFTRRDDVLTPIAEYTDRAFAAVLPCYNLAKGADTVSAIRLIRSQILNIQSFDWTKLAGIMEQGPIAGQKQAR